MKRIIPLFLLAIFAVTAISCNNDDDNQYVDYDTFPVVYDLRNVDFEWIDNVYTIARTMDNPMYDTDVMLIYMQTGSTQDNSPIWQQIPTTIYGSGSDEIDYNFDFSRYDFQIYAGGNFDLTGTSYIRNKTFRIVFVPASGSNRNADNQVDYSNYESVINAYNIDDTNVGSL